MINNSVNTSLFNALPFAGIVIMPQLKKYTVSSATTIFLNTYFNNNNNIVGKDILEIFSHSTTQNSTPLSTTLNSIFANNLKDKKSHVITNVCFKTQKNNTQQFFSQQVDLEIIPVLSENLSINYIIISITENNKLPAINNGETKNNEDYRSIIENSLNAFFLAKPDGTLLEANKAACDMFGYTLNELRQIGRQGIVDHVQLILTKK